MLDPFPFSLICFGFSIEDYHRLLKFIPVIFFLLTDKSNDRSLLIDSSRRDAIIVIYCKAIPTIYSNSLQRLALNVNNYDVTVGTELTK